eukprot:CAMPEP_0194586352 /NCGR_PEP_ID=MMETSP0292-20121207/18388_1 /TAXON_ID=39354 /ORGANISM="Heterosigma akashiwo, Strain CCMP2393" /LENGTH=213 /DNA_ID=CAMNT_0039442157 /DNA_START=99 /DNA_END=736 /DNA_ORIENTATION=+
MGDKQKECSLCNILASFSGGNDQDDESSSEISSSSDDSSDDENSVKEVKERRSKQRSKQMKKTSGKVKSTPAVNKNAHRTDYYLRWSRSLPRGQEDFTLKMGDKQKECSLCNILASFSGGNDQDDESSSEISSSSDDSSDDENSVKEVKERRSKQRSKQMKKTSGKVKSTPAVNKNGKTGSAAKQQLSDVKDGQSGAQPLDDQAEDSNQIEKP